MKYEFKGFYPTAPLRESMSGDGSFVYEAMYFLHNTENNDVFSQHAVINVPGNVVLSDVNPFVMAALMQRVNAMWNNAANQ